MRMTRVIALALVASLSLSACGDSNPQAEKMAAVLKAAQKAYYKGDYVTAAHAFQALAQLGDVRAEFFLGELYLSGNGVPQDYAQALKWSHEAAEQGSTDAQFTLGRMYELGLGVPQDYVQAHIWYNLSSSSGDEQATRKRDLMATKMSTSQTDEALRREKEWLEAHRR